MHGGYSRGLEVRLQAQVEIWRINADENTRTLAQQVFAELFANAQQTGDALENLYAVTMHSQAFTGPLRLKAPLGHLWPTNAAGTQIGPSHTQAVQHKTGEQVAGGLAGHHGYLRGWHP